MYSQLQEVCSVVVVSKLCKCTTRKIRAQNRFLHLKMHSGKEKAALDHAAKEMNKINGGNH